MSLAKLERIFFQPQSNLKNTHKLDKSKNHWSNLKVTIAI